MNNQNWSVASLRISSSVVGSAKISSILGIEPTIAYEKGTPLSHRNPKSKLREQTIWLLESGLDSSVSLERHIEHLVKIVENKINLFKELAHSCEMDLSCGFSSKAGQGGLVLESHLLQRMALIQLDFILDLYPPSEDTDNKNNEQAG
jgi:Domain of unknown function (DUF4279)